MTGRVVDLDRTVRALCADDPAMADVLADIGFPDVKRPGVLETAGRFMTIPAGAAMRRIPLDGIVRDLRARGYEVIGGGIS